MAKVTIISDWVLIDYGSTHCDEIPAWYESIVPTYHEAYTPIGPPDVPHELRDAILAADSMFFAQCVGEQFARIAQWSTDSVELSHILIHHPA